MRGWIGHGLLLLVLLATINVEHGQRYEGEIPETLLYSLVKITSPSSARAAVPIGQAAQASLLYRQFFCYPAPFDPEPLVALWQRCSRPQIRCAEGLEQARRLRPPDRVGVH